MKKIIQSILSISTFAVFGGVFVSDVVAQTPPAGTGGAAFTSIDSSVNAFGNIVQAIIPILFALAIIAFFYTLAAYILNPEKEGAKSSLGWGIVVVFVMASIWGIISLLQNATGTGGSIGEIGLPSIESDR